MSAEKFIFQIILGRYRCIPEHVQDKWKLNLSSSKYTIIDNRAAEKFLRLYFDKEYVNAFLPGNSKWKADLLRFCLMSKYPGIYSDVDLCPSNDIHGIPSDIDTITVIGAHSEYLNKRLKNTDPNGELAIGFIKCNSPEPIFIDYMSDVTPKVVASGKPYGINIQGLYAFLCKRWGITKIIPFQKYTDPIYNRTYYFLKEKKTESGYKIFNKEGQIVIHSQYFNHEIFHGNSSIVEIRDWDQERKARKEKERKARKEKEQKTRKEKEQKDREEKKHKAKELRERKVRKHWERWGILFP